jgi:hypothetical protein
MADIVNTDVVVHTVHIADQASQTQSSLPFRITTEGYGISVAVMDDSGHQMGEVLLEFFNNQVKAHFYHPEVDHPVGSHVFVTDVAERRKQSHGNPKANPQATG